MKTNNTIKYRLLALILCLTTLGVSKAEAQAILVTLSFDANSADGGRWQMPAIGGQQGPADQLYDGTSDFYYIYESASVINLNTLLTNRLGINNINQIGTRLVNVNGYTLTG